MGNNSIVLMPIHRNLLHSYWTRVREFLAAAVERNSGEMDLDDVLAWIVDGRLHLFGFFAHEQVFGAGTVQIVEHPQKRVAMVVHLGGDLAVVEQVMPQFDEWAREHQIDSIMLWGRKGWEKVLADKGFKYRYTVLERVL